MTFSQKQLFSCGLALFALTACGSPTPTGTAATPALTTTEEHAATDNSNALAEVVYTAADSAEVVQLLRDTVSGNDVLYYARHFIGRPYVAHTLEVADPEQLVVNLRELDCTTFVETVTALVLTKRQHADTFSDFCRQLTRLRYRGGHRDGYLSRLHYFTWWMHDNIEKGIVCDAAAGMPHDNTPITVCNHYMSTHADAYAMLRKHPEWTDSIAAMERAANGADGSYIPERFTRLSPTQLTEVCDGDILAIVTTKDGLDYSHLGFAVWGKDQHLHLLNASSVYHKVVEDSVTLYDYLARRKTSVGIRPLRLVDDAR